MQGLTHPANVSPRPFWYGNSLRKGNFKYLKVHNIAHDIEVLATQIGQRFSGFIDPYTATQSVSQTQIGVFYG